MRSRVFLAVVFLGAALVPVSTQSGGCEPDGKVRFICGVPTPEDLVPVPGGQWVIASGFSSGTVQLVNTKTYVATRVFPAATPRERFDKATYAACPGPLDPAAREKRSTHGLAIAAGSGRAHTVYVVHHGERESIEVFELDTRPAMPTFTWIGCVIAPQSAAFNSVTPLAGGGFAATNTIRRGKPQPGGDSAATGEIWEWNAKNGFKILAGSEAPVPNGIEASPDGRWLYVNLWRPRKVMRLSRGQTPVVKDFLDVNFQPDNIRWQSDGTLLATGQDGPDIQRVIQCLNKLCADAASVVARIDPTAWTVREIVRYPANERFFSSTIALQVGKEIWMGGIMGERIVRYPLE